jgi:hypothetical protein
MQDDKFHRHGGSKAFDHEVVVLVEAQHAFCPVYVQEA